jgi:cytochrome c oxidase cbb3-type subunit 3
MMTLLSLAKCSDGAERGGAVTERVIRQRFASKTPKTVKRPAQARFQEYTIGMHMVIAIILAMTFPCSLPLLAQAPRGRPGRRVNRQADTNPLGRTQEVIEAGRQLYNSSCTDCHGLEGTAGDRGPALAATRRYLRSSDDDLFAAIKKGIPGTLMPPAGVPDNDIWKIVAYIRSLRATASDEFVAGDVKHGEEVFRKSGCAGCHMLLGRGGLLGPDLSNVGGERSLADLRQALTSPKPTIPLGYQPVRLTAISGDKVEGVVKNEDNFSLQVMDRSYRIHLLKRDEVEQIEYGNESLMPSNFSKTLSAVELQDLLAFLSRQVRQ